jgi:hypothetical protein
VACADSLLRLKERAGQPDSTPQRLTGSFPPSFSQRPYGAWRIGLEECPDDD